MITIVGAGYVGGCTAAILAEHGHDVTVADVDAARIERWNGNDLPIFEPGLAEMIARNRSRLAFTTDVAAAIDRSSVIFIAVNTPTKLYGVGAGVAYDMSAYESVARSIARHARGDKIVVEKSTVPVRTADMLASVLSTSDHAFSIVSNPEFLAEGTALADLATPDRVLIGGSETAVAAVRRLYHWVPSERIVTTNVWSSELAKLAANAFLAQRVSSINAIAQLCEVTGADVTEVARAVGADTRIGAKFMRASVGFGGSCFSKDVLGLVYLCEHYNLHAAADYWRGVVAVNDSQKRRFCERIYESMSSLRGKVVAVLGAAFKNDTGDIRESPALDVIRFLHAERAVVNVYDPKVSDADLRAALPGVAFRFCATVDDSVSGAHAVAIVTDWHEFRHVDWHVVYRAMERPAWVFDGRNVVDASRLRDVGFNVHCIGKN